uniref:Uncharacterized protein LOC111132676 n=1 Tax=Crassostrea virginica TaxID=6565 RepID=A0A8B8E9E8_CRAVI|nr:uncharacterized protein LOC111132676 [Crassostrea virginica]
MNCNTCSFLFILAIIHTVTGDIACVRKGGTCQHILNRCNKYQRGLCNGGWTRQCCINNNPGDTACIEKGLKCQQISNGCNQYQSGLCSGGWTRRCCFNTASTSCSAAVKSVACRIKYLSKISLLKRNPSGVIDGADPYSNIRDACAGRKVKRSSYTCSQGKAPGGTTCLDLKVLQYIYYLGTTSRYRVQVNAIAGACHSRRSKHYAGKAVDLQLFGSKATRRAQEKAFRAACSKRGGWSHGGTHVHCQIV